MMSPKAPKKNSKGTLSQSQKATPQEERAMQAEIKGGLKHLQQSIGEIQRDLRNAEHKLETDARAHPRIAQGRAHPLERPEVEAARGHGSPQGGFGRRRRILDRHQTHG